MLVAPCGWGRCAAPSAAGPADALPSKDDDDDGIDDDEEAAAAAAKEDGWPP